MTSKKQYLIIILATLIGFANGAPTLAGNLGGAFAYFLLTTGLVLGYNGVDLTERLKTKLTRTK